jgi:hypothetical protein
MERRGKTKDLSGIMIYGAEYEHREYSEKVESCEVERPKSIGPDNLGTLLLKLRGEFLFDYCTFGDVVSQCV